MLIRFTTQATFFLALDQLHFGTKYYVEVRPLPSSHEARSHANMTIMTPPDPRMLYAFPSGITIIEETSYGSTNRGVGEAQYEKVQQSIACQQQLTTFPTKTVHERITYAAACMTCYESEQFGIDNCTAKARVNCADGAAGKKSACVASVLWSRHVHALACNHRIMLRVSIGSLCFLISSPHSVILLIERCVNHLYCPFVLRMIHCRSPQ